MNGLVVPKKKAPAPRRTPGAVSVMTVDVGETTARRSGTRGIGFGARERMVHDFNDGGS